MRTCKICFCLRTMAKNRTINVSKKVSVAFFLSLSIRVNQTRETKMKKKWKCHFDFMWLHIDANKSKQPPTSTMYHKTVLPQSKWDSRRKKSIEGISSVTKLKNCAAHRNSVLSLYRKCIHRRQSSTNKNGFCVFVWILKICVQTMLLSNPLRLLNALVRFICTLPI